MNVPDDWGMYYSKCGYCGSRYHASEGGCGCLEDAEQCVVCRSSVHNRYGSLAEQEGWHPIDDLHEIGGSYFCEEHAVCLCCEAGEGGNEEEIAKLKLVEDTDDELVCPTCEPEDHWCEAQGPLLDHMAAKVSEAE